MNELVWLNGGEDDPRVLRVDVENENWERIETCHPVYTDEEGNRFDVGEIINENDYHGGNRNRGYLKCRFDSDKVGHYNVNLLHSRHGRARNPRKVKNIKI